MIAIPVERTFSTFCMVSWVVTSMDRSQLSKRQEIDMLDLKYGEIWNDSTRFPARC